MEGLSTSGPRVGGGSGGRPREVFRYSFHTAYLALDDQRWGKNVHRVFLADIDQDQRKRSPWRLPPSFYMDITYQVKEA